MRKKYFKNHIASMLVCMMLIAVIQSCKTSKLDMDEPEKDITGSWQVVKAVQNGVDVTEQFDFSKFRVNFDGDKYTLTGQLPFIVQKDGTWSFNDPQYPFNISFVQEGSATAQSSVLYFPIVNGQYQIGLTFSPGCIKNSYQYTLQQIAK